MPEFLAPGTFIEEKPVGANPLAVSGSSTAGFVVISEKGPVGTPVFVSGYGDFVRKFGSNAVGGYGVPSVKQYFRHGGARTYICRTCHYTNIDNADTATAVTATKTVKAGLVDTLKVDALSPGTWGNRLKFTTENKSGNVFDLIVKETIDGVTFVRERFLQVSVDPADPRFVEALVNTDPVNKSNFFEVSVLDQTAAPDNAVDNALTLGNDGLTGIVDNDYVGSQASHTGLYSFDPIIDILNVAIPGVTTQTVINGIVTFCENNTARQFDLGLIDFPIGLTPQQAVTNKTTLYNGSTHVYYSYLWGQISGVFYPPSAIVAGLIAQTDRKVGPWRAPAGEDFPVGIDALSFPLSEADEQILYPRHINFFKRTLNGFFNWGVRTGKENDKFKFVTTRRLFNVIGDTAKRGLTNFVFSPNGPNTWGRVKDTVEALMGAFFSGGAFAGKSKEESFFVEVNADLNPPEQMEQGILKYRIGIADVKPAEFVDGIMELHTSLPVKG